MDYMFHGILQARILEWVAIPFSSGSSQSRDRTQVSHIGSRFFTSWATREAQGKPKEAKQGARGKKDGLYTYQCFKVAVLNLKFYLRFGLRSSRTKVGTHQFCGLWWELSRLYTFNGRKKEGLSPSKLQRSGLLVFSDTTPHSTMHLWQIWFTQK